MLELLLNKRLRENYNKLLQLENLDEINEFLSTLNESEKSDLLCYVSEYAVKQRKRTGFPITEYALLHYKEYAYNPYKDVLTNMDKITDIVCIIFAFIFIYFWRQLWY